MLLGQEKVAEYIKKWITQKEVKKVWEAIRNITRRKERTLNFCGISSHKWVSYFQELFSINSDRMLEGIMTSHNRNCRIPWNAIYNSHNSLISSLKEILNIDWCWWLDTGFELTSDILSTCKSQLRVIKCCPQITRAHVKSQSVIAFIGCCYVYSSSSMLTSLSVGDCLTTDSLVL
jgi:hypothetical protein